MLIIFRILAIAIRLVSYYSPIIKQISKHLRFEISAYSVDNLRENYLARKQYNFQFESESTMDYKIFNSDNYFTVNINFNRYFLNSQFSLKIFSILYIEMIWLCYSFVF
jgi:hypothetical protein